MADQQQSTLIGLLATLLGWLNNPWKAVVLAMLGTLGVFIGIVWDQRVTIVTVLTSERSVVIEQGIDRQRAPATLMDLLRDTHGAVAAVSEWDIDRNRRTSVVAVSRQGRRFHMEPRSMPIVRSPRLPSVVLPAVMAGEVPCVEIPEPPSGGAMDGSPPDIRAVATEYGITAYCLSGISTPGGTIIGSVMVMFMTRPADERAVAVALRRAAAELLRSSATGGIL